MIMYQRKLLLKYYRSMWSLLIGLKAVLYGGLVAQEQ